MPQESSALPFFVGNTVQPLPKRNNNKAQSLSYNNGYAIHKNPLSIGGTPHESLKYAKHEDQELIRAVGITPSLIYGKDRVGNYQKKPTLAEQPTPAYVAFDKKVLRFNAFFKQTVYDAEEQFMLRKVDILYFIEDDSIAVVEKTVENSGIPQGVLLKRQRMPKDAASFYSPKDFNLGQNITFYGKTFRIANCDAFTRKWMQENEGVTLNAVEQIPEDPYIAARNRPKRTVISSNHNDNLKRFLEHDREVLRFYCIWDDRNNMFGEVREFTIHYYLVDDSIEIREKQNANSGRDGSAILLRRQLLPKKYNTLEKMQNAAKYTWKDFRIGSSIDVLGRKMLIHDIDGFTRRYYVQHLNLSEKELQPCEVSGFYERQPEYKKEVPPYNGFGTEEDSLGSWKHLVLKAPKKDFNKMLDNEHKVFRFAAVLESQHKEDQDRQFIISYRLSDDMMTIYEPPKRNAGFLGGKFMERTHVLRPGATLQNPSYYCASDLYVGATITVFSHRFKLVDADDYVFNFMEQFPDQFPQSNVNLILSQLPKDIDFTKKDQISKFGLNAHQAAKRIANEKGPTRKVVRKALGDISNKVMNGLREQRGVKKEKQVVKKVKKDEIIEQAQMETSETETCSSMEIDWTEEDQKVEIPLVEIPKVKHYNPLLAEEYEDDIFEFYREKESHIGIKARKSLVNWIVGCHKRLQYCPETLHLTINLVDRFMMFKNISLKEFKLVGAACILVASKFEEIYAPAIPDLASFCDGKYNPFEILEKEKEILNVLEFEIGWPGPFSFLRRISKADDYELRRRTVAKYFLDVMLEMNYFITVVPSKRSAVAYGLSLKMFRDAWSSYHTQLAFYTPEDIEDDVAELGYYVKNELKKNEIFTKYTDSAYMRVSKIVEDAMDGFTF